MSSMSRRAISGLRNSSTNCMTVLRGPST